MSGTNMKELLRWRTELFAEIGGIQQPTVQNEEWLYLLEEETRNSLMIEGYFSDKKTLKNVIGGKDQYAEHADKITGYFDAASLIYEYAYQKYKDNVGLSLQSYDIKTIHSLMFKSIDPSIGGKWRTGNMMITGAKIEPLYGYLMEDAIQFIIEYIEKNKQRYTIVELLARFHVLFEATHPFEDGNGRVGRILINYLLVSLGYPNIIIKGTDTAKKQYFNALEAGEIGLYDIYPETIPKNDWDKKGNFSYMENIIYTELFQTLDIMILSKESNLIPVKDICIENGYTGEYARKLVKRGQVIAKKLGNTRHSTPSYFYKALTPKD